MHQSACSSESFQINEASENRMHWCMFNHFHQKYSKISNCHPIHQPLPFTHRGEEGETGWTRPRMWIMMSLSGCCSWGINCSLMCVALTALIMMTVTHQWSYWTFPGWNVLCLFSLHISLKYDGSAELGRHLLNINLLRKCLWCDGCF